MIRVVALYFVHAAILLVVGPLVIIGSAVGNVYRALRASMVAVTGRKVTHTELYKETNQ